MGCFLGCFGAAKDKKDRRRRSRRKCSPSHSPAASRARHSPSQADRDADAAPLLATLLELRDSADDLCLAVVAKKKVTFDPNVTAYEAPPIPEGEEATEEEEEGRAGAAAKGGEEEAWTLLGPECAKSEAFPLNHRYGSCAGADDDSDYEDCYDDDDEYDDEYEDDDEEEDEDGLDGIDECAADDDDEEHHGGLLGLARAEEEACESLFLLPVPAAKTATKDVAAAAAPEAPAVPVADPATAVLSSVENFGQWKDATKSRTAAPKDSAEKENSAVTLSDPAAKQKQEKPAVSWDYTPRTPSKQEASVDTSLSTWLGSCGTPESNYSARSRSPISREDRPILGALTVEDIKISSANSTPSRRSRSPSPSPDDMPILGTVGAYWNCSNANANGGLDDSVTRGGFMKTRSRFGQNFA